MTFSKSHPHHSSTVKQPLWQTEKRAIPGYYNDILVAFLVLATPFLLFPQGYGLLVLLLLPGLWGLRWVLVGRIIPRTPLDWPILLILFMILVSMWATFDLSFSIGKIASLLLGIVIYYAVIDLSADSPSLQRVMAVFILIGVGLALFSMVGTRWPNKFPLIQPVLDQLPARLRQVQGAEEGFNPNQVGGILLFFVPLQVALLGYWLRRLFARPDGGLILTQGTSSIARNGLGLIFVSLSLLLTGGVLFITQSRGALGGLIVGLLTISAIQTQWGKVIAIVSSGVLAWMIYSGMMDNLVGLGLDTEVAGTISLAARLEIWAQAVQGLSDFPLGMGMNNFRRLMPALYPLFSIDSTKDMAHAHNHLLQAGLDLGIPGLIGYLALWVGLGFLLFQVVLKTKSQFYQAVALGLIGSFTAHFVYGITDTVALGAKPGFVFWWALSLGIGTYKLFYKDGFARD